MNLSNLTNPNLVELNSNLTKKDDVIKALIKKLYQDGKITSEEEFLKVVYAREALSETGMEAGLAIPHGKSTCVKEASFAVMSTKDIVSDWESLDPTNEVKYVFLLAIPESEAGSTHLELLAQLMQKMSDSDYKEKLFASKTKEEFINNLDNERVEQEVEIEYTKTIVAITACPAGIAHTYMAAEALVKAGNEMGVRVVVEKQGANGIEGKHTAEDLKNADAAIFAVDVAPKNIERFNHLPITKTPVAEPLRDAKGIITRALKKAENFEKGEYIVEDTETKMSIGEEIKQAVMTGISHMVPLVVSGGMILAIAVLISQQFGLQDVYNEQGSWLNLYRQLSGGLLGTLLVPVMAAYMAYAISEKTALVSGFAAGYAANMVGGGFLAGMLGGLIAGYIVRYMKKYIPAKGPMAGFVSFFIYPVLSTFLVSTIMFFVIGEPVAFLNNALTEFLRGLQGTNAILLGAIIGIMTSFDLGGPVNKAAYAFCVSVMNEGVLLPYAIFASVKMVSGFAITLTSILAKECYTQEEQEAGKTTWMLALGGITEGAIPFMMKNPLKVIGSLCAGSAVCGAIVAWTNVGLNVPGAGIFSMFLLDYSTATVSPFLGAAIWLGAAVIGALVSTAILVPLMKKGKVEAK